MNTIFKYGSSANLGNLAITNGQIIACSNTGAMYYDLGESVDLFTRSLKELLQLEAELN